MQYVSKTLQRALKNLSFVEVQLIRYLPNYRTLFNETERAYIYEQMLRKYLHEKKLPGNAFFT